MRCSPPKMACPMHELAICQALLTEITGISRQVPGKIRKVTIQMGPLSGAEPALLARAYPIACAGTLAEGSELVIVETLVRVRCHACNAESEAKANRLLCAVCGEWRTELLGGDELLLQRVEIDSPAASIGALFPTSPEISAGAADV